MKLFKRSLAAMLAMTMALTSMAATAFAEDAVEGGEEDQGPELAVVYTADSGRLADWNKEGINLQSGWYGDNGYSEDEAGAGANAKKVRYADADLLNNHNEIIYELEMQRLEAIDYTLTFQFAFVRPEVVENPEAVVTAIAPRLRYQDGTDLFDYENLTYKSVSQLTEMMKEAKAKGENFITMSMPIKVAEYGENLGDDFDGQIKIECRLSSNIRGNELGYGDGTHLDEGVGVAIRSFQLAKGLSYKEGLDKETGIYYENNAPAINKMVGNTGTGYYFTDENGKIRKDYVAEVDGATYYFGTNGKRVANVIVNTVVSKISAAKAYYYFGSNGKLGRAADGKVALSGKTYYVKANGVVLAGAAFGNNYFKADGSMAKNEFVGSKAYDGNGNIIKNAVATVAGAKYAFNGNGDLIKNGKKVSVAGKYVCTDAAGKVIANKKVGKYVTDANGFVVKNGLAKAGKTTYFVKNYKVVANKKNTIYKVGKKSYMVKKNGVVATAKKAQAIKAGKKLYAVKKNGQLYGKVKKLKIGKKNYKVDKKGVAKVIKKK